MMEWAEGVVYAAPSSTGRWHVVIDGRACCSPVVRLVGDEAVTVGRAPLRGRCGRLACAKRWESRVSESTRLREGVARRWAQDALVELGWTRTTENRAHWERQGWLGPHQVFIVRHRRARVLRVGITARDAEVRRQGRQPGCEVVEVVEVPTRFDAVLMQLAVLDRVDRWRRELPPGTIPKGGTQVWSERAPAVSLYELLEVDRDADPDSPEGLMTILDVARPRR